MTNRIFIHLPVKDLQVSVRFFKHLGFCADTAMSEGAVSCMVIGHNIFSVLIPEDIFEHMTHKKISDAHTSTQVLISIDVSTKQEVDEMVKRALEAGGTTSFTPTDHGWMYQHGFADPDGHLWEVMYMNHTMMDPTKEDLMYD